jgi:hypothetical protein
MISCKKSIVTLALGNQEGTMLSSGASKPAGSFEVVDQRLDKNKNSPVVYQVDQLNMLAKFQQTTSSSR